MFHWGEQNSISSTCSPRSSSGELRIRVPFFSLVYFSRGTLPKKGERRALLKNLVTVALLASN